MAEAKEWIECATIYIENDIRKINEIVQRRINEVVYYVTENRKKPADNKA